MSGRGFNLQVVSATELIFDFLLVLSIASIVTGVALLAPAGYAFIAAGALVGSTVVAVSRAR